MPAFFDKIEIVFDSEIDRVYKKMKEMDLPVHGAVEITLQDTSRFDSGLVERGAARCAQKTLEKIRRLTAHAANPAEIDRMIDQAWYFEQISGVRRLIEYSK